MSKIHELLALVEEIDGLVRKYAEVISHDHHKHRDGQFEVILTFDAYQQAPHTWTAVHNGYLTEWAEDCSSLTQALVLTKSNVQAAIKNAEAIRQRGDDWGFDD